MPATLLATLVLLAGCTATGAAVCRVCGLHSVRGAAPAIGVALLMTVASPASRLISGGWFPLVAIAVVAVAGLVFARPAWLLPAVPGFAAVALPVIALITLPWLASGHDGLLGMGMNNDTPVHLVAARWLVDHAMPVNDTLVAAGYPLGPHALAVAASVTGLSLSSSLTAVNMLAPPLVALAALDALPGLRPTARRGLAVIAGLSYIFIAYYAQLAFKEPTEAALLLSFVLLLGPVISAARSGPRTAARAAVPLAVLLSGTVQTMSWAGLIWPIAMLVVWLGLETLLRRRSPLALVASARGVLWSGAVVLALLLSFEVPRIVAFQGSHYAHEPEQGLGNLEGHLQPYKAIGVWLNPDFRFATALPLLTTLLIVATGLLALAGVREWLRRGNRALPATLISGCLVWVGLDLTKNAYNAAKALPVVAPVITLAAVTGAVWVWRRAAGDRSEPLDAPDATMVRFAGLPPAGRGSIARALVVAVLGAGVLSSLWTLREAVVGVDPHAEELKTLVAAAPPGPMLVLDNSDWASWYFYPVDITRPPLLYPIHTAPLRWKKEWRGGDPYDLDSVTAATLNRFSTVVTANNPTESTPPRGLTVLRRTRSFVLWKRTGTVPPHKTLAEGNLPGAALDCSAHPGLAHSGATAVVRPTPVVGPGSAWHGTAADAGTSAWQTLDLPPGRWDLALQYVSRRPLTVTAPGLRASVPATLDRLGPLFGLGTATGGGTVRITVRQQGLDALARALGTRGRTRALNSPGSQPLGMIVATRHGVPAQRIPIARACGRYVDWYTR